MKSPTPIEMPFLKKHATHFQFFFQSFLTTTTTNSFFQNNFLPSPSIFANPITKTVPTAKFPPTTNTQKHSLIFNNNFKNNQ
jgi:hypothetical protein